MARRLYQMWFQSAVESQGSQGEPGATIYVNVASWWCHKHELAGEEGVAAQQVFGVRPVRFLGRFKDGVTSKMVLSSTPNTALVPTDGTKRYDIQPPSDPDGQRRKLEVIGIERGG